MRLHVLNTLPVEICCRLVLFTHMRGLSKALTRLITLFAAAWQQPRSFELKLLSISVSRRISSIPAASAVLVLAYYGTSVHEAERFEVTEAR